MKKKFLSVLAVACVACLSAALLTGCSQQQSSSNDGNLADNKLIVGFDNSYPPYGFMDENNNPTGFDLDLAQEVANRNGWDIQLEPIDWDSKDALLNQGTINCIWNGFTMEGREDNYTFSEPYMLNEQVVVVKKGSGISSLSDLAGKTVVTQADSAALDVLQGDQKELADTFKSLQTLPDYNNAFMQLESGMVDAVACDLSIAQYQISAKPDAYQQLGRRAFRHGRRHVVGDHPFARRDDRLDSGRVAPVHGVFLGQQVSRRNHDRPQLVQGEDRKPEFVSPFENQHHHVALSDAETLEIGGRAVGFTLHVGKGELDLAAPVIRPQQRLLVGFLRRIGIHHVIGEIEIRGDADTEIPYVVLLGGKYRPG